MSIYEYEDMYWYIVNYIRSAYLYISTMVQQNNITDEQRQKEIYNIVINVFSDEKYNISIKNWGKNKDVDVYDIIITEKNNNNNNNNPYKNITANIELNFKHDVITVNYFQQNEKHSFTEQI